MIFRTFRNFRYNKDLISDSDFGFDFGCWFRLLISDLILVLISAVDFGCWFRTWFSFWFRLLISVVAFGLDFGFDSGCWFRLLNPNLILALIWLLIPVVDSGFDFGFDFGCWFRLLILDLILVLISAVDVGCWFWIWFWVWFRLLIPVVDFGLDFGFWFRTLISDLLLELESIDIWMHTRSSEVVFWVYETLYSPCYCTLYQPISIGQECDDSDGFEWSLNKVESSNEV